MHFEKFLFHTEYHLQGRKKMLLDGGADHVGDQPTYRRVWGHASLGQFLVYALKSILVHSETNNRANYTTTAKAVSQYLLLVQ